MRCVFMVCSGNCYDGMFLCSFFLPCFFAGGKDMKLVKPEIPGLHTERPLMHAYHSSLILPKTRKEDISDYSGVFLT
jgi:hypothetical protein